LLLHVLDVGDLTHHEHYKVVCDVLEKLNVGDTPIITVLNKIDKLTDNDGLKNMNMITVIAQASQPSINKISKSYFLN